MMESVIAGFALGFVGSLHCIGMCGPLALSLPVQQFPSQQKWVAILLYNFGRLVTYALLGVTLGSVGQIFAWWGMQQIVSILTGLMLLLFLLGRFSFTSRFPLLSAFQRWVNSKLGHAFSKAKRPSAFFVIGILNGLLPCGLVYAAITASVAMMNSYHGLLLMVSFGMGTFPMMIGLMRFSSWIKGKMRQQMKLAIPFAVASVAVLLILRGLNLGIPYISPKADMDKSEMSCCHKPH